MRQFSCPSCQRTLKSKPELVGKLVACPCGHQIRVPGAGSPTAAPPATSPSSSAAGTAKLTLKCPCGKTLAVPQSSRGKAVRCPCGKVLKVPAGNQPTLAPSPRAASSAPAVAAASRDDSGSGDDNDWLSDLPSSGYTGVPASPAAAFAGSNSFSAPAAARPNYAGGQNSLASSHLANARHELNQQQARTAPQNDGGMFSGERSVLNGGMITGLLTMIAAGVWFFGGLAAGVIFFYPPVLFIIGLIAFLKGVFGNES